MWEKYITEKKNDLVVYENSFKSSGTRGKNDWWLVIIDHQNNTTEGCLNF